MRMAHGIPWPMAQQSLCTLAPLQDILRKMLRWDPVSRLSVEEAVQPFPRNEALLMLTALTPTLRACEFEQAIAHPYLDKLHCPEERQVAVALRSLLAPSCTLA